MVENACYSVIKTVKNNDIMCHLQINNHPSLQHGSNVTSHSSMANRTCRSKHEPFRSPTSQISLSGRNKSCCVVKYVAYIFVGFWLSDSLGECATVMAG